MEAAGAILRRLREEQGLTVEQISARTRIRSEILREIEDGNYRQVAGGPFLQGFIKAYAQALGQSGSEIEMLMASVKEVSLREQADTPPSVAVKQASWLRYGIVALLVVASLFMMITLRKGRTGDSPSPSARLALPAQPPRETVAPSTIATPPPTLTVTHDKPVTSKPDLPAGARPDTPPIAQNASSPASAPQKTVAVRLTIKAVETCWLRGLIDGTSQKDILLNAGEEVIWGAEETIRMTIGNAGGVILTVNGKEYKGLGKTGQVISGLIITKDGINHEQVQVR